MQTKFEKQKIEAVYPLSFLQQALLFHRLEDDADQGFLQIECELTGLLDPDKFQKAWRQTIQRHELLRASVHWENLEKTVQVVHKKVRLPFLFYDWSDFSRDEQLKKYEELRVANSEKGIDISSAPVFKIFLCKQSSDSHLMLWVCHHILVDGWSSSVILKDLLTFYEANENDRQADLPEIPSYKAYLRWLRGKDISTAKNFWEAELQDFSKPTLVGRNTTDNSEASFHEVAFDLSINESNSLREFAKRNRVTLNTLIQGVWSLILSRFTDKTDVTFGIVASGRSVDLPYAEQMVGMFMNVLPLRIRISRADNTADWLRSLQVHQSRVLGSEHVALDKIIRWANLNTTGPLFNTITVFENMPVGKLARGGLIMRDFKSGLTSKYPLTLAVIPSREIKFFLKYDSSVVLESEANWFGRSLKEISRRLTLKESLTVGDILDSLLPFESEINSDISVRSGQKSSDKYRAPKNAVELKLTGIWETLLNVQPIGINDDFFKIGGTSLTAIRILADIEEKFGRSLNPSILLQHPTIDGLAKYISSENGNEAFSTLVPLRASGSKPPIYCLHAGGGHVFFYKDLARFLGRDQPVYALQRLGLDDITQAAQNIETMASHYLSDIRKIQPRGPYFLLAYCFSTGIAWEITKQLQMTGESVAFLAMIDSPPRYRDLGMNSDTRSFTERTSGILARIMSRDFSFFGTMWKGRIVHPTKRLWRFFVRTEVDKKTRILLQNLNRTVEQYKWTPLPVNVTLIRTESMARNPEQNILVAEWNTLALNGVNTFIIKGDHAKLYEEPNVEVLAKKIGDCLAEAKSKINFDTSG